jgi:hypothetical protein
MGRTRLLAATALGSLVLVAPAGAVTGGFGASTALQGGKVLAVTGERQQHSCQANRSGDRVSSNQFGRKFAPVACEQPPKSDLLTPGGLSKAVASAIAALG